MLEEFPKNKDIITVFDSAKGKNIIKNKFDSEKNTTERRTSVTKQQSILFGKKLILKKGPVNDLYCGICEIYEKFEGQENILPIVAMSLRLLLDTAARAHYIAIGNNKEAEKDTAYKNFLKEEKKSLKKQQENSLSLNNDWLSDERDLDALLGKYAHGSITCKQGDILKDSIIIADILQRYFKKDK